MEGEERRDDRAAPCGSGDSLKKQEKKQGVRDMDQHVHEQVPAGIQTKELAVQHMREPGERMPVGGVKRGEGPGNSVQRQAAGDHGIVPDVKRVIEIDELVTDDLAVNRERDHGQGHRD